MTHIDRVYDNAINFHAPCIMILNIPKDESMVSLPKVSIIIPVYNVERYLGDCLSSVLSQEYKNLEILAINDGSTDNCRKILEIFSQKDSRIKVLDKENGGVSSARNLGLITASGEYILFLDSDDLLAKEAVAILVRLAQDERADIITFGFKRFYKGSVLKSNKVPAEVVYSKISTTGIFNLSFVDTFKTKYCKGGYAANRFYRREVLQNIFFDTNRIVYEDEDFISRVIASLDNQDSLLIVDFPLYYYRQRRSSSIHTNRVDRLFAQYSCRRLIMKRFVNDPQKCAIADKARLITLIKLAQVFLTDHKYGIFRSFKKIIVSRKDLSIRSKIPYLFGRKVATVYSQNRLKKSKIKNELLQYWE